VFFNFSAFPVYFTLLVKFIKSSELSSYFFVFEYPVWFSMFFFFKGSFILPFTGDY
jgi:hypothetical protein